MLCRAEVKSEKIILCEFSVKTTLNQRVRVNQNSKVVANKNQNNELKEVKTLRRVGGTAEWGDNSLWVHHHE